jgi:branched-chain amino acid transport system permease protein
MLPRTVGPGTPQSVDFLKMAMLAYLLLTCATADSLGLFNFKLFLCGGTVPGFQDLLQFVFAGITSGAIYALIALGFAWCTTPSASSILPRWILFPGRHVPVQRPVLERAAHGRCPALRRGRRHRGGHRVERLGVRPSRSQNHLVLIFLTIGISIILRGVMKLVWGKNRMAVPPLVGEDPLRIAGAAILPQAVAILMITAWPSACWFFFSAAPAWAWHARRGIQPDRRLGGGIPVGASRRPALPWPAGWAAWPAYW